MMEDLAIGDCWELQPSHSQLLNGASIDDLKSEYRKDNYTNFSLLVRIIDLPKVAKAVVLLPLVDKNDIVKQYMGYENSVNWQCNVGFDFFEAFPNMVQMISGNKIKAEVRSFYANRFFGNEDGLNKKVDEEFNKIISVKPRIVIDLPRCTKVVVTGRESLLNDSFDEPFVKGDLTSYF